MKSMNKKFDLNKILKGIFYTQVLLLAVVITVFVAMGINTYLVQENALKISHASVEYNSNYKKLIESYPNAYSYILSSGDFESSLKSIESGQLQEIDRSQTVISSQFFAPAIKLTTSVEDLDYKTSNVAIAECKDCKYFPVDKDHALPHSYRPEVVPTGLSGGGKLTAETVAALKELFSDARKNGHDPRINSAFRSYEDQLNTFYYWVRTELKKGKDIEQAIESANSYSARPGHSEHQLGTTVDVSSGSAGAFDKRSTANKAFWAYLGENAHRFGFVISYPSGSEKHTGYIYEPWHIRFLGIDMATKIHETGYVTDEEMYPAKYLKENL